MFNNFLTPVSITVANMVQGNNVNLEMFSLLKSVYLLYLLYLSLISLFLAIFFKVKETVKKNMHLHVHFDYC